MAQRDHGGAWPHAPGGSTEGSRWCSEAWRARTAGLWTPTRHRPRRAWRRQARRVRMLLVNAGKLKASRLPPAGGLKGDVVAWRGVIRWFPAAAQPSPPATFPAPSGSHRTSMECHPVWRASIMRPRSAGHGIQRAGRRVPGSAGFRCPPQHPYDEQIGTQSDQEQRQCDVQRHFY